MVYYYVIKKFEFFIYYIILKIFKKMFNYNIIFYLIILIKPFIDFIFLSLYKKFSQKWKNKKFLTQLLIPSLTHNYNPHLTINNNYNNKKL